MTAHLGHALPVNLSAPVGTNLEVILDYVANASINLVVTDLPVDPPADVDGGPSLRDLLNRIECPVLVPGRENTLISIERVLVPADLSDHALSALEHAAALAHPLGASVDVLHVIDSFPYVALTATDRLSLGPTSLSEHRGQRQLRAFLQQGRTSDVPTHSHLAYGDPVEEIGAYAVTNDVDLLVLSSHGRGGRADRPFGDVPNQLLQTVACPVLLLPAFGHSLLTPSPDAS